MTNFTQDLKTKPQNTNTEQMMTKAPKTNPMMSDDESKITILAPSFTEAAIMFHKPVSYTHLTLPTNREV